MELQDAIKHCHEVANSKCGECANEHQQLAEWLTEFKGYKDETPITEDWLNEKFFYDTLLKFWDFNEDVNAVEIRKSLKLSHFYSVLVPFFNYKINVRTRGELRCFFSACGFDYVKKILQ